MASSLSAWSALLDNDEDVGSMDTVKLNVPASVLASIRTFPRDHDSSTKIQSTVTIPQSTLTSISSKESKKTSDFNEEEDDDLSEMAALESDAMSRRKPLQCPGLDLSKKSLKDTLFDFHHPNDETIKAPLTLSQRPMKKLPTDTMIPSLTQSTKSRHSEVEDGIPTPTAQPRKPNILHSDSSKSISNLSSSTSSLGTSKPKQHSSLEDILSEVPMALNHVKKFAKKGDHLKLSKDALDDLNDFLNDDTPSEQSVTYKAPSPVRQATVFGSFAPMANSLYGSTPKLKPGIRSKSGASRTLSRDMPSSVSSARLRLHAVELDLSW
jgi:hypothetical protein